MSVNTWRTLDARDRALVAIAVLVDGNDAKVYLGGDARGAERLKAAAEELCQLEVDARLTFVGTVLRLSLEEAE